MCCVDSELYPPPLGMARRQNLLNKTRVSSGITRSIAARRTFVGGRRLVGTTTLRRSLLVGLFCSTSFFTVTGYTCTDNVARPVMVSVAAATSGLPTPAANGSVSMTLHQVNGDGAGYVAPSVPFILWYIRRDLSQLNMTLSLHF